MPRPDWLRCETCLWFVTPPDKYNNKVRFCHHTSRAMVDTIEEPDFYCNEWTCANCFGSYDSWASRDPVTEQDIYVDHGKCREARFVI